MEYVNKEDFIKRESGRTKDLSGQVFGNFKVLYRIEYESDNAMWLCECMHCNRCIIRSSYHLTHNKLNHCDCLDDLTGKKFGRWTVLYLCKERTKNRGKIYHCKCECGNEKDVPADTLRKGESKSCGCLQKEIFYNTCCGKNKIDITGQRFGKLTAIYPIYSSDSNKHTKWHCKCDCGTELDVDLGNLRSGKSLSCGCTLSFNEENIAQLLTFNNIPFIKEKIFKDLPLLRFDFYVNNKYIIEFDGLQHFQNSGNKGWNTKEKTIETHERDMIKNNYCFKNNIPLIRISYKDEYNLSDLILDTTRYLFTKDKMDEYYLKYRVV